MTDISIIIVSYNTKDLLRHCLQSVFEKMQKIAFEVLVVDNASTDGRVEMIRHEFPRVTIIINQTNLGFGSASNLASKQAKGKTLLFLNSDTTLLSNVKEMVDYVLQHREVAIAGGKILTQQGKQQHSAKHFLTIKNVFLLLLGKEQTVEKQSSDVVQNVDWVEGSFLLIKSDVFDHVGRFDERIFMYTEDMELCYRVHQAGYTVIYYPYVSIQHIGQGSSNRSFAIVHIYQGILYFYQKHKHYSSYVLVKLMLQLKAVGGLFVGMVTGNSYLKTTYQQAFQHTL